MTAGIDRVPLVRMLTGNRSEPEEDLDSFFCSELVGHLLVVAGVLEHVNVSKLAPSDILGLRSLALTNSRRLVRVKRAKRSARESTPS